MNSHIKKVLLLGSGALKIGEAGEFDYSGSQAIKALKEEGVEVVLINPNIATVQTSWGLADKIYFLPVNYYFVRKVIQRERPDGILLGFGGQTALNCGVDLYNRGILAKYNVKILGTSINSIRDTEDRKLFRDTLNKLTLKCPNGGIVYNLKSAIGLAKQIGFPIIARGSYSLGGRDSGIVKNEQELKKIAVPILNFSHQLLLEEYLNGWKEIEYEIARDKSGNCVAVCNMENLDPIGIHTGESIVVAPSQTLSNDEYHNLRSISLKLINHLKIIGECNIQFALHPKSGDYRIIEVNARLSRSSALASKATGYPLAFVAAKLALGKKLYQIKNPITRVTTACFEPALDYVVVKIPRWDFKKFKYSDRRLGPKMQSIGEVMAIGRNFEEALQKAVRMVGDSIEGLSGFFLEKFINLKKELLEPTDQRLFAITSAFFSGWTIEKVAHLTKIDPWFLEKISRLVAFSKKIKNSKINRDLLVGAKKLGFSDAEIAKLVNKEEKQISDLRAQYRIFPVVRQIDTLAGEFAAKTNYLYLTYGGNQDELSINRTGNNRKIMILGSGAYKIGSSVEFDWCAVRAGRALKKFGYKTIFVNYNPETVSTDYDESDKLYFEELSLERIKDIYHKEKPIGIIVSVGGQIPNNLVNFLHREGMRILGTHPNSIDIAENRYKFASFLEKLDIQQPKWIEASNKIEIRSFIRETGFPILVRPSYVLSGSAMAVAFDESGLFSYLEEASRVNKNYPVVMSKFITGAKELEIDAVAKRGKLAAYAIIEHVENAGVHSGDASLVLPAKKLYTATKEKILEITKKVSAALNITGPFNIQFLAKDDALLVIECNLRASRSIPFVSKVYRKDFIELAIKAILNRPIKKFIEPIIPFVGVKMAQFSFSRITGADPVVAVDMVSTGEVACLGKTIEEAFLKSWIATGLSLPSKNILLTLGGDDNKMDFLESAYLLKNLGYKLFATKRTRDFLWRHKISAKLLHKPSEKLKPSVEQWLKSKKIDLVVNTSDLEFREHMLDDYLMRRLVVDYGVPLITNTQFAKLFIKSISNLELKDLEPKSWGEY